jgi:4-hydroxybenzoate polyprenyltransferase
MALLNASKFSIDTIWYLAVLELLLGIAAAFFVESGLWFWMIGFGILHIVYGFIIYYKYEQ